MLITETLRAKYRAHLIAEEKAAATVKAYTKTVSELSAWLDGRSADKELIVEYKELIKGRYAPASVNAAIAALNSFFAFSGAPELKLKTVRIRRRVFADKRRELSRDEYSSLIKTAKRRGSRRLYLILQTIFATGIRISELRYITVEAVRSGSAVIDCKGKLREILIPKDIRSRLRQYIADEGLRSGSVFLSKRGNPVDRSNTAKEMKRLADAAKVEREKVFPHNLRHLFARAYYAAYKDIVRLADILGHSSISTTRIYTMESGDAHRKRLDALRLTADL